MKGSAPPDADGTHIDRTTPATPPSVSLQRVTMVGALLFIAASTLLPSFGNRRPLIGTSCLLCGEFGTPDLVLNVLLFVPFGIALGMRRIPAIRALGLALLMSAFIESMQLVLPGRSPTLRDVLTNAVGGGLGALIALHLAEWLAPGRRSMLLLWLFTGVAVAAVGVTGLLLRPVPTTGRYAAHWAPRQDYLARWTGSVDSVFIDGRPVPGGWIQEADTVRVAIARGAEIRIKGHAGRPTRRLSGIFTISDDEQREILLVGGIGDELVVRSRRLAAQMRLHSPHARFPGLLRDGAEGAPFELIARGDPMGGICASVNAERRCAPPPTAGRVWTLFLPMQTTPPLQQRIFDLLTFFSLAFPVALWMWSVPPGQAWAGLTVLAIGLAAAAWSTGLGLPAAWEWCGLFLAVPAGRWLHGRLVPRSPSPVARSIPRLP